MMASNSETAFVVGRTYECRAFSDYDVIYRFTVTRRTARTIWVSERGNPPRPRRVRMHHGVEVASPHGRGANMAVIFANRPDA
jgi:hypothetical protein